MTDKANEHRGEIELLLGDQTLVLRPSYTAIAEWENATSQGSVQLLYRMSTATYRLAEIVAVVGAAARAGGRKISDQKVGELLVEHGVIEAVPAVARMVAGAMTGGREADPEGEATATAESEKIDSPSVA
jgi:hypothetical protein